jgi:hydroxymethylglutaryl-CoA reductase
MPSELPNFKNKSPQQRLDIIIENSNLTKNEITALSGPNSLPIETADGMVENVIGKFELPLGIATNFLINGKDYLIPMAVEEPSIIAAASHMAKIIRKAGGFRTSSAEPIMRAQIQILYVSDPNKAKQRILDAARELIELANSKDTTLIKLGGGCKGLEVQIFENTPIGSMVILHLLVDVRDAMGANIVNTMAEALAPTVEKITGGKVRLRILSNLADLRLAKVEVQVPINLLKYKHFSGLEVASRIIETATLAEVDPYRAATHNKGIMNGIDPVALATGNDWRAIEAGAHAWAAQSGHYKSLSKWRLDACKKNLSGSLEMPVAVGIVGGATKTHPTARACVKLLGVKSAGELAQILVAVGLAQNMAALRALATEGIQKGHMALHAKNIAIAAGATDKNIKAVMQYMLATSDISLDNAILFLAKT